MHRSRCYWCGKKLTDAEWNYGACFECIDKKAEEKGWKPGGAVEQRQGRLEARHELPALA